MKKLMLAAAALAVGSAFAIESSNIVGYQNKDVTTGLSQQIATFAPVGGGKIDLQKLVPVVNAPDTLKDGNFVIQFYSETGKWLKSYYYWTAAGSDLGVAGWQDRDGEEMMEDEFDYGEGFMMSNTQEGYLTYNGEVAGEECEIPVSTGLMVAGNPRPSEVNIQDIYPVTVSPDTVKDGNFVIQSYSTSGKWLKSYYYWTAAGSDLGVAGWQDRDGEEMEEKTFAAGEGFMMSNTQAGSLVFPAMSL